MRSLGAILKTRRAFVGDNWNVFLSSHWCSEIAFDGIYYVTVEFGGLILVSTDKIYWRPYKVSINRWTLNTIHYANGYWVVGGFHGEAYYATDPTGDWTKVDIKFVSTNVERIYSANGLWVALGQTGKLSYASDPTGVWTLNISGSFNSDDQLLDIVYESGLWVLGGVKFNPGPFVQAAIIAHTNDPTGAWTVDTSTVFGPHTVRRISYGAGYYVAIGSGNGQLATSTDPTTGTWTLNASASSIFGYPYNLWVIGYGNGNWITGAGRKSAYASNPSGTWTLLPDLPTGGGAYINDDVKYLNNGWVGVGHSTTRPIITKPAATGPWNITWGILYNHSSAAGIRALEYGDNKWVISDGNGNIVVNTDVDTNWYPAYSNLNSLLIVNELIIDIKYGNGYWVAISMYASTGGHIYTCTDPAGIWTKNTTISGPGLMALLYANGLWTVVGKDTSTSYGARLDTAPDPSGIWTRRYSSFTLDTSGYNSIQNIIYGNGYWVAIGSNNCYSSGRSGYSVDGINWTRNTSSGISKFGKSLHYGNGYFVSTESNDCFYTTDPTGAWSINHPPGITFGTETALYYNAPYWVNVGSTANGIISYASNPASTWYSATSDIKTGLYNVCYGNNTWIAVGSNGRAIKVTI